VVPLGPGGWGPGEANSVIHSSIFRVWPAEGGPGDPGRASSVAEGRERVLFRTRKSFWEQLFASFYIFKVKVHKAAMKIGGGPWMDFLTFGPTSVHVL